jgi:uncharacterized phage protein gp47/JayE
VSGYVDVPLETDPDTLSATALDALIAAFPGWVPYDTHLEVWLIETLARMVAEARDVASRVPKSIFRYFGQRLLHLDPINAAPAGVFSTWTMADAAGYTVPAGTVVAFRTAGDTLVPFQVLTAFTVSPGNAATLPGQVELAAIDPGTGGNGLTGAMEMVDALAFVAGVAATTVSAGGVEAETDDAYLDRLADELELLTPRPILSGDFAKLARRTPGVARAFALDNYNPATDTFGNERMVAVAVVDAAGAPLSGAVKADVDAQLQAQRETNFIVNVMDPTYTVIAINVTVTALPDFDHVALKADIEAALAAYISPANWGGGDLDPPEWRTTATVVRYLEVAALVNAVPGVDFVTALTINGGGVDVALAGRAPLPTVGAMVATVNP